MLTHPDVGGLNISSSLAALLLVVCQARDGYLAQILPIVHAANDVTVKIPSKSVLALYLYKSGPRPI